MHHRPEARIQRPRETQTRAHTHTLPTLSASVPSPRSLPNPSPVPPQPIFPSSLSPSLLQERLREAFDVLDRDRSGEVRARARDCAPAPPCTGACLRVCRAAFHRQRSGREARLSPARARGAGGSVSALTKTEPSPRRSLHRDGAPETPVPKPESWARHRKPASPWSAGPRRRRFPCLVSVRPRACAAVRSGRGPALCTGIEDNHPLCAPESKTITAPAKAGVLQERCFLPSPSDTHLGPVCCSQRAQSPRPRNPQTALPRCPLPSPAGPPTGPPRSLARFPASLSGRPFPHPSLLLPAPCDCTCGFALALVCCAGVCVCVHSRARA